ncbi:putative bifunctional diguanylate cyclase/phosphodiesterase [Croceicoccus hydrothermalis]|uniref:putative bifunctional diguanylate cyclase/phosphodiesterase n=1 Tax=Croceicoccus hydrothermalis TaxID=2867964 RepID=UPI001EFBAD20
MSRALLPPLRFASGRAGLRRILAPADYHALGRWAGGRVCLLLAATIPVFTVFSDRAGPWVMGAWFAIICALSAALIRMERGFVQQVHIVPPAPDRHQHCGTIGLAALAFALPTALFPGTAMAGPGPHFAAMQVLLCIYVVALARAARTALLFAAIFGIGGAAGLLVGGGLEWGAGAAAAQLCTAALAAAGAVIAGRLVTALDTARAGAREREETLSLLLREAEDDRAEWLWQIDGARRMRHVSPRFAQTLGIDALAAEGLPLIQAIAGEGWETGALPASLRDLAECLKERKPFSNMIVRVHVNGAARWWALSGTPLCDEGGRFAGFRGVGSDVTERTDNAQKVARLARYDQLTGLPNRMMLNEGLRRAMSGAASPHGRCAFLIIDLDRFKTVNDTLGHGIGDGLLRQMAQRLRAIMGTGDMCGRMDGDEFGIVMTGDVSAEAVQTMAATIIERLSRPYDIDRHAVHIGLRIGSATYSGGGDTEQSLMRRADLALERAKEAGGGIHLAYEPGMQAEADKRRALEHALNQAIENAELDLQFQPVVDTQSESIVGFEALLRWNSAAHGRIGPDVFIPIAERTGAIVPIGEWVLNRACEEAAKWPAHVRLAVNVSPEQLLNENFTPALSHALDRTGLAPARLELEMTESVFLRDGAAVQATFRRIEAMGCTIALDDFGTGYSSLGYLRTHRFSTIKIDRSFVQGATKNSAESVAILRAVVALADALDMTTTAEGVENDSELENIRRLGCTRIQGFLFGSPMDAREALALFGAQAVT